MDCTCYLAYGYHLVTKNLLTMLASTTAVVADPHEFFRDAYHRLLRDFYMDVACTVSDLPGLMQAIKLHAPRFVFMDALLPGGDIAEACHQLRQCYPAMHLIVFTGNCGQWLLHRLMQSGVQGIISKTPTKTRMAQCLESVENGDLHYCFSTWPDNYGVLVPAQIHSLINKQERMIIEKIFEEKESRQIADEMCLSVRTVENYRKAVSAKIGASNVVGVVKFALRHGIVWM